MGKKITLDFSKVEAGEVVLDLAPASPRAVVQDTLAIVADESTTAPAGATGTARAPAVEIALRAP